MAFSEILSRRPRTYSDASADTISAISEQSRTAGDKEMEHDVACIATIV
jgi:hypothetical protein